LYPYRETFYFNANKVRLYFKNILKKKNMPTEKLSQKFGKRRCGGEKTDCSLQNLYAIRV
jgi:hypothetical protein